MFTINIYVKFAIIALCLGGGLILAFIYSFWYALPFFLIGLGFLASYLLLGTVQSTAQLVQEMKFDEAEQRINLTYKPEWLYKTNRAFYYIMKGTLAMNRKDNNAAEEYLKIAQTIELPTDDERAMVELQLANIDVQKQKWNSAKNRVSTLKKLKVSQPQVKAQIKQFDDALAQRGQMKHMNQGGGKNRSMMRGMGKSKRRRPKMR